MPDQSAMYDRKIPAHRALGARARPGGDAGSTGPDAASFAYPAPDRRAYLRYAKSVDGGDALSHEAIAQGQHRNEFACPGLQPETRDADRRNRAADASNEGLNALVA